MARHFCLYNATVVAPPCGAFAAASLPCCPKRPPLPTPAARLMVLCIAVPPRPEQSTPATRACLPAHPPTCLMHLCPLSYPAPCPAPCPAVLPCRTLAGLIDRKFFKPVRGWADPENMTVREIHARGPPACFSARLPSCLPGRPPAGLKPGCQPAYPPACAPCTLPRSSESCSGACHGALG